MIDIHKKVGVVTQQEMPNPGREIHFDSLTTYAAIIFRNKAHIILPKTLIGEYVEAVIESEKDLPDAVRIMHFVDKFGNGGHLLVPKYWANKKIFVKRKGVTEKQAARTSASEK